jgi:hypothetical protein
LKHGIVAGVVGIGPELLADLTDIVANERFH